MSDLMMLVDIAVIIIAAKTAGQLMIRIGQPQVVGEISVGVLLAALLRGHSVSGVVLASDVKSALHTISTLGIVLFMFTVGYHWEPNRMGGFGRVTAGIATGSLVLPFLLGTGLGFYFAGHYHPADRLQFLLFLGTTMSITALPVLARIVEDRDLRGTVVGGVATASAAAVDATSWAVLAAIVALAGGAPVWHLLLAAPYLVALFLLRPAFGYALRRWPGTTGFGVILAGLFLSAAATQWLGLHVVFGAFLFGAMLPSQNSTALREQMDEVARLCQLFLLPVFFVVAALDVNLAGIGVAGLGDLGLILLVAVGGKICGAYAGARVGGMRGAQAISVATLMNARGVTEIVVLQVGLQLHVVDERLYSLMVLMALLTTAATGPLLSLIARRARRSGAAIAGTSSSMLEALPAASVLALPEPGDEVSSPAAEVEGGLQAA
ncbi:MAG: cation:proton antiporter [Jatrophihabitantaceae bacterium]